jgi:CheY-like chemotaxis protein
MFEAFEQMESKRSRTDQGTGLGLAIMRELVSMMDGSINVESVVGEGSTFTVSLILKAVHARAPAQHAEIIVEEAGPVAYHVLVGEDNDVIAMILEQMLDSLGWRVFIVKNGEAVVEEATREGADYDVILMDIQMPVIDGIEATRLIRSRLSSPPPIVALTANTLETDVKLYLEIGMAGVVSKPIQRDDLIATVNEAVGKAQAQP